MKRNQRRIGVVEITHDAKTTWVNTAEGNIGRFGVHGIDVHTTISAQLRGASQCLACTHGPTHLTDWRRFQLLMFDHYGIEITDRHMPDRIKREVSHAL